MEREDYLLHAPTSGCWDPRIYLLSCQFQGLSRYKPTPHCPAQRPEEHIPPSFPLSFCFQWRNWIL